MLIIKCGTYKIKQGAHTHFWRDSLNVLVFFFMVVSDWNVRNYLGDFGKLITLFLCLKMCSWIFIVVTKHKNWFLLLLKVCLYIHIYVIYFTLYLLEGWVWTEYFVLLVVQQMILSSYGSKWFPWLVHKAFLWSRTCFVTFSHVFPDGLI